MKVFNGCKSLLNIDLRILQKSFMHICTEISGSTFPADLKKSTIRKLFKESHLYKTKMVTLDDKTIVEADEATREAYKKCLRGLAFISQCEGWRYVGQGVRLGDKKVPVCWWRTPGTEKFKVLYGNLQIKEVSPEQIPILHRR